MRILITPEIRRLIEEKLRSGHYATPEDVLLAGLNRLGQDEMMNDFAPGELDALLIEGERSIAARRINRLDKR